MRSTFVRPLTLAFLLVGLASTAQAQTLISSNAVWRYLDNGSDQGTAWRGIGFADAGWAQGPAELGYGDDTEARPEATVVGFGSDAANKFITTYFRHTFNVANPGSVSTLLVSLMRDDGAVVYLNGVEVVRNNLPAGAISFTTLALGAIGGTDEATFYPYTIDPGLLQSGANVLAVEMHQSAVNSSDLSFDLELVANHGRTFDPPTVTITSPTNTATVASRNVTLQATTADADGVVVKVEYFQGATKVAESAQAPFTAVWIDAPPGAYSLTARATDSTGQEGTSTPVNITVVPPPASLISLGSVWKYLANGTDQGTGWTALNFPDASWPQGPGQLGYGDGDEATIIPFGPDPNNKYITYYFRHVFNVDNPNAYSSLPYQLIRDDGAVIYLNGVEVARLNMPPGPVNFQTFASSAEDFAPDFGSIDPSFLVAGQNILAIEMHQGNVTSSDLSMDFQLSGNTPPSVFLSSPLNGAELEGPLDIVVSASANDSDGTVSLVEFFANGVRIGQDTTEPFSITWTNVGDNVYSLFARATDNTGGSADSDPVNITVTDPNPPALASAIATTNKVFLTFSKRVAPPSATTSGNYTINQGVMVTAATQGGNDSEVVLDTTFITPGVTYTLTVNNIQDFQGNTIAPNSQITFDVADFLPQDIGGPSAPGNIQVIPGGYSVTGSGSDIGGTSDQFFFSYKPIAGDFDLKVRLESFSLSDSWAKAGLMARATLDANSAFAATLATPASGTVFYQARLAAGVAATSAGSFPVNYPHTWVRLRRVGNAFTAFGSWDGQNWQQVGASTIGGLPSTLLVGFAVASRTTTTSTVRVQEFQTVVGGTVGTQALPRESIGPSNRRSPFIISEIMYHPRDIPGVTRSLEFIEIYNSQAWDEDIGGYRLSGAVDYTIPDGTILKSGGFLVVARDPAIVQSHYGITGVFGPWENAEANGLPNAGGTIRFRGRASEVLQQVEYTDRPPYPLAADGAGHSMVMTQPSYGEQDPRAWGQSDLIGGSPGRLDGVGSEPLRSVMINEFLAHTDPGLLDFIELYNHSTTPVDVSGAYLSDERNTNKFRIPNGTIIGARGFVSFDETQLGFRLDATGERIFLVNSNQTRVLDAVIFEGQANAVSSGRYPDGSPDIAELQSRTPGQANSAWLTRDIVINEIMYNPITGNSDDEYLELYNKGATPVNVGGWRVLDGISFAIPVNTIIPSDGYLVIARNAANLIGKYSQLTADNTKGDYDGSLANGGERIVLAMPEEVVNTNQFGQFVTNTTFVTVDEVEYRDGGRWGWWSDGGGSSLELIDPRSDNRRAHNWADSDETAKAPWTIIEGTGPMSETWRNAPNLLLVWLQGIGECLLDDVEMRNFGAGNSLANGGFETGTTGWTLLGSHDHSRVVNEPFSGSSSLHLRAASRGDNGGNRIFASLSPQAAGGVATPLTVRAKARWLRGWPELMLRLSGGGYELHAPLTVPPNLGSPGQRNGMAVENAGPAIWDVTHQPILPAGGEPIVITARAHDPDGIASLLVRYRLDNTSAILEVPMQDNGLGGDRVAGDGLYSATVPGQNAGAMIVFHLRATDNMGQVGLFPRDVFPTAPDTRLFPSDAPSREIPIRWGDSVMPGRFATYRLWVSDVNRNRWNTRRPVLNNAVLDGTFVYNNSRVIYNMLPQYAGSPWHRGQMTSGPDGAQRVDYDIEFPPDNRFLGVRDAVWNNPGNPGGGTTTDTSAQTEQTSYLMFKGLNVHYNYRRYMHMFVNGSHRSTSGNVPGTFIFEDSQQPNGDAIDEWSNDATDGTLYKVEDWFEFDNNGESFGDTVNDADLTRRQIAGSSDIHIGAYRFMFRRRAVGEGDSMSNYDTFINLLNAVSPESNPNSTTIENLAGFRAVADYEQWMRIFAVQHAVGNWDAYGYDRGKNAYMYTPIGGRFHQWTWDIDFTMGIGGHNPPVIENRASDSRILAMWRTPEIDRAYWRAFQDLVDGPWSNTYMNPILDAKAAALRANGVNFVDASLTTIKNYITSTRAQFISALAAGSRSSAFALNAPSAITTNNNAVILQGTAPVKLKDLQINGVTYPVEWVSINTWRVRLAAANNGANAYTIVGLDSQDNPVPGANLNFTVNYTGQPVDPVGNVVFSEIMYNPTQPNAAYVEIHNRTSDYAFDISGWEINGLGFDFPDASIIGPGEYITVAKDPGAFSSAYGGAANYIYNGNLDLDGETLTLLIRGESAAQDIIIDKVRYEPGRPWPTTADGAGPSLQLLDPAQDNSRSSNWSDGAGWRFFSFTGRIGGSTLFLFLNQAGTLHLDNITVVTGEVAEVGMNLVVNGDMEQPFGPPWAAASTHSGSTRSTDAAFAGNGSLRIVSTGVGSAGAAVTQQIPGINNAGTYTMSFWFLPTTDGPTLLTARFGSTFRPEVVITPVLSTPGAANSATATLPAYPDLWLNEIQTINTTGPLDNVGDREPWVELYNAGTTPINLQGLYLSADYDNLTQWAFPQSSIGAGEFKLVWLDGEGGETNGGNLHTSFRLDSPTGSIALSRIVNGQAQVVDYLNFSGLTANQSYGDFPDGQPFKRLVMGTPTPGAPNQAVTVTVFINEWLAQNTGSSFDPADGNFEDWFELYNAGTEPADLSGYFMSDDLTDPNKWQIPNGIVIPAGGFLRVWADEDTDQDAPGQLHADFRLSLNGESIGLYSPDLFPVDEISFGTQTANVSEGRFPDGSATIQFFETPTPGASNTIEVNDPPAITPIADVTVDLGEMVSFSVLATDPQSPAQTLSFSLDSAPPGAAIGLGSGLFTWTPTTGPSTNDVVVRVTDNGNPPRSATDSFKITVIAASPVSISRVGNQINLSFATEVGRSYRIDYKDNLNDPAWTQLSAPFEATMTTAVVTDNVDGRIQRFYRLVQID